MALTRLVECEAARGSKWLGLTATDCGALIVFAATGVVDTVAEIERIATKRASDRRPVVACARGEIGWFDKVRFSQVEIRGLPRLRRHDPYRFQMQTGFRRATENDGPLSSPKQGNDYLDSESEFVLRALHAMVALRVRDQRRGFGKRPRAQFVFRDRQRVTDCLRSTIQLFGDLAPSKPVGD